MIDQRREVVRQEVARDLQLALLGLADELTGLAERVGSLDVSALADVSDFVGQTQVRPRQQAAHAMSAHLSCTRCGLATVPAAFHTRAGPYSKLHADHLPPHLRRPARNTSGPSSSRPDRGRHSRFCEVKRLP